MGSKHCGKCRKIKSLSDFYKRTSGYQSWCKQCNKEDKAKHYQENKPEYRKNKRIRERKLREFITKTKDAPCMDCGKRFHFCAMDFDHVNGTKEFTIGSSGVSSGLERLKVEIAKCEVVCAVCHRIRTYKRNMNRKPK